MSCYSWYSCRVVRFYLFVYRSKCIVNVTVHCMYSGNYNKLVYTVLNYYLSGTFVSGKITISQKNLDVINAFNCSTTSFHGKGYYDHSQMSRIKVWSIIKIQHFFLFKNISVKNKNKAYNSIYIWYIKYEK
jgi:predicted oxidoreductase